MICSTKYWTYAEITDRSYDAFDKTLYFKVHQKQLEGGEELTFEACIHFPVTPIERGTEAYYKSGAYFWSSHHHSHTLGSAQLTWLLQRGFDIEMLGVNKNYFISPRRKRGSLLQSILKIFKR